MVLVEEDGWLGGWLVGSEMENAPLVFGSLASYEQGCMEANFAA